MRASTVLRTSGVILFLWIVLLCHWIPYLRKSFRPTEAHPTDVAAARASGTDADALISGTSLHQRRRRGVRRIADLVARLDAESPPPPASAAATAAAAATATAGDSLDGCHVLPRTELPGDVVRWGDGHSTVSAAACCAACTAQPPCNSWVWCGAGECEARRDQCWLKTRPSPWADVDLLRGRSSLWTSGVLGPPPSPPTREATAAAAAAFDCALRTPEGLVRLRLRSDAAPLASSYAGGRFRINLRHSPPRTPAAAFAFGDSPEINGRAADTSDSSPNHRSTP